MQVDFKKELESANKSMIMVHDPKLLMKLIARTIVQKFPIKHAAMLLFEPKEEVYILTASRGKEGFRIPKGFTHLENSNPIIQLFCKKEFKALTIEGSALVADEINHMIWKESIITNNRNSQELLHGVSEQMNHLNSSACIPVYYRDKLLGVLLLGKKSDNTKFTQEEIDFFYALASNAAMAIRNAQLFERLKKESERNHKQFLQTIIALSAAIEAKDAYTHGHTERVTHYALAIARQMVDNGSANFPENFFENLYISSLLHDIGKIAIPESILNKNSHLTDQEYSVMKKHPEKGVEIIKPLDLPEECLNGILGHHEHFDGKGYPQGLQGSEIPIFSSIISVADTFDAITSSRTYRKGKSKKFAIEEIKKLSGQQFHPATAKAITELFNRNII